MIPVPSGVQVWLASGHTDMRKGFDGLALLVQETLKRNPHSGHLFVFRGRRGVLHVLVREAPRTRPLRVPLSGNGVVTITPAQLGYLLEGIDSRLPQHTWRPQAAG
jgi:transposase